MPTEKQSAISGKALRRARLRNGWTQRQLAEECLRHGTPVSHGNIARAELGQPGGLGPRKLPVIAKALGVDIDELLPEDLTDGDKPAGVAA